MSSIQAQFYEQLDKLDDYLVDKNQSERTIFAAIVGAIVAGLVYFMLYDLTDGYKTQYQSTYNDISGKLQAENDYIASMDNGGFLQLEQQMNGIKTNISQSNEQLKYLQGLIGEVYGKSKDWFLTFDEASRQANRLGLTVNGTDIELGDSRSLGGMKYSTFVLFGYGRFSQILNYIDWLETHGQFISLDNIIIESKDNRLNFSVLIRNFRGGV